MNNNSNSQIPIPESRIPNPEPRTPIPEPRFPIPESRIMRDEFIREVIHHMHSDESIYFVAADFGSPVLDELRNKFPDRFINVGIAEQNLINVSVGLALEGATVFAYAIASFITMRCYEQIRVNLAVLSELKELNVNLVGVGAGFSYVCSGPSHQALEDISIMRTLPNLDIISPPDWFVSKESVKYCIEKKTPKYIRLDGMALSQVYSDTVLPDFKDGFAEIRKGMDICIISTGYMTQKAIDISREEGKNGAKIAVIDVFKLNDINEDLLVNLISKYKRIITLEEGFKNKGGLDSMILFLLNKYKICIDFNSFGLSNGYKFELGTREELHENYGVGKKHLLSLLRSDKEGTGK